MIDYSKIKHTVPPVEAAKRYGSVKHGFMRCPFHADRTPSLKLYSDHFHCFGSGSAHPRGLVACKRELERCRQALAPRTKYEDVGEEYAEACRLGEWTGYLLEVGASGAETRRIERETARLMEACNG